MEGKSKCNKSQTALTLLIGASGSIGQKLCAGLIAAHGSFSVVAAIRRTPLPESLAKHVHMVSGVDIRDATSLQKIFDLHPSIDTVWNLAAPLSVDTAKNPENAHDVTVGGMERLLTCCVRNNVRCVCFTDSIGSFGEKSPRRDVSASWLVDNPKQDPGSDYGRQKRQCRSLLDQFHQKYGLDTRWAVVPGVLHTDIRWGGGTTEYAMDAIKAAVEGRTYKCPIAAETLLPMIHIDDLVDALVRLQTAPRGKLASFAGYCISGFSFNADQLFTYIKEKHCPSFRFTLPSKEELHRSAAAKFSRTWPDSIDSAAAAGDLHFHAKRSFGQTIDMIVTAHRNYFGTRAKL